MPLTPFNAGSDQNAGKIQQAIWRGQSQAAQANKAGKNLLTASLLGGLSGGVLGSLPNNSTRNVVDVFHVFGEPKNTTSPQSSPSCPENKIEYGLIKQNNDRGWIINKQSNQIEGVYVNHHAYEVNQLQAETIPPSKALSVEDHWLKPETVKLNGVELTRNDALADPSHYESCHGPMTQTWLDHVKETTFNLSDVLHDASPFVLVPSLISLCLGVIAKSVGLYTQDLTKKQKAQLAQLEAVG
jgi:hypothetical protein